MKKNELTFFWIALVASLFLFAIFFFFLIPLVPRNSVSETRITSVDYPVFAKEKPAGVFAGGSAIIAPKKAENKAEPAKIGPVRLIISKIGVNAIIQDVGINASGRMAVPSNYKDVGWYKYGVKPGDVGNAVIDGHLDNSLGMKAVFWDLDKLKEGDEIKVFNAENQELTFKVVFVESYDYKSAPLQEIFGFTDKNMLNLITCDGTWIRGEKNYSKRLVVFSELVSNIEFADKI